MKIFSDKSTLLTGAGLGFGLVSIYLTVDATKRAQIRLKEAGEGISTKEKIKIYLKEYSGVGAVALLAAGCIIKGKAMDAKHITELVAVGDAANRFVKAYSKNVEKQIGKEKSDELKKKARVEAAPDVTPKASEMVSLLDGDQYFLEPYSGKIFASSTTKIENAVNIFNARLNSIDEAPLYDLFEPIVDSTPCDLNKELLEGQVVMSHGFISKNGLIAIRYWDPIIKKFNGNKISCIPISFVDGKTGCDRDPLEYYEEGAIM